MLKVKIICLIFLTPILGVCQKSFNSPDYSFKSPSDFTFSRDNFIDGFVDILTVIDDDSTENVKYLIYLHKINIGSKIDASYLVENPTQYTSDLNCTVLTSKGVSYNGYDGLELEVKFDNSDEVVGYVFMTAYNSTLRRIIFMVPNEEYYEKYFSDIQSTLNNLELK
ncbi:MAG: hypothetical protein AAF620_00015 [Bacteroidota bacterium]